MVETRGHLVVGLEAGLTCHTYLYREGPLLAHGHVQVPLEGPAGGPVDGGAQPGRHLRRKALPLFPIELIKD